jgi:phosphoribosylformylglycinamidine synthase
LMPHPEHAIDSLTGPSADGLGFFTSVLQTFLTGSVK